jgi:putative transcriptional regulator
MKRNLFAELSEGFDALAQQRVGKTTLRTVEVEAKPAPDISAMELKAIREKLKLSRPVFAHYLRTNPRTLENWEQGRAKPNAQAIEPKEERQARSGQGRTPRQILTFPFGISALARSRRGASGFFPAGESRDRCEDSRVSYLACFGCYSRDHASPDLAATSLQGGRRGHHRPR